MLRISRNGIELDGAWLYDTEPIKSIYLRVNTLEDGSPDINRTINIAELKYIYYKSAILPTNPFSGANEDSKFDSKMRELSNVPATWSPDSLVVEAIVFFRKYQKDLLPTSRTLYNLFLILHGLATYYEGRGRTLKIVQNMLDTANLNLEQADSHQLRLIAISESNTLNETASRILEESLSALPKIQEAIKSINIVYEQLRGDMSQVSGRAVGKKIVGNRENPE